jgi:hypothetical protein
VFASNRAPLTEVGGDAARYIDPENLELAASIVAAAAERLPAMRRAGFLNALRFDTRTMVAKYVSLYEEAIRDGRHWPGNSLAGRRLSRPGSEFPQSLTG